MTIKLSTNDVVFNDATTQNTAAIVNATSLGTGQAIYKQRSGANLEFNSVTVATTSNASSTTDTLKISTAANTITVTLERGTSGSPPPPPPVPGK